MMKQFLNEICFGYQMQKQAIAHSIESHFIHLYTEDVGYFYYLLLFIYYVQYLTISKLKLTK